MLYQQYAHMIKQLSKVVGDQDIVLSAHCHNDLGLAVANSLAVEAGNQIECTINGIGDVLAMLLLKSGHGSKNKK